MNTQVPTRPVDRPISAFNPATEQLVQTPIEIAKGNCTTYATDSLTVKTMRSLRDEFDRRGHAPSPKQYDALQDLVSTMEAMAEGVSKNTIYLSSLDPGVGKTSAVIKFIQQLVVSTEHDDVSVLLCLPRLDEIRRLIKELDLGQADTAVATSNDDVNVLGLENRKFARVLITTHQMVAKRCADRSFAETECFHYRGRPREVRLWDEEMLPGEVITVNSDQLNALPILFRNSCHAFGDFLGQLAEELLKTKKGTLFEMPDVQQETSQGLQSALSLIDPDYRETHRKTLEALFKMSSRTVRVSKGNGRVVTALDIRDALPKDIRPILVMDASGRVRNTYEAWELGRLGLTRLKDAPKDYSSLNVSVMEEGGGKFSWTTRSDEYLNALADLINSKPNEEWLVVYHGSVMKGRLPQELRRRIERNPDRVKTVNWGAHQGRNDFAHISNVILAGTLFYPEHQYEGLAHLSSGTPVSQEIRVELLQNIREGENMHLILQGLCRASVRGSINDSCKPCDAYLIARKGSGIRDSLTTVFPGCTVGTWKPLPTASRGKVAKAISLLKTAHQENAEAPLLYSGLMQQLGIDNRSNFNRTILKHEAFKEAMVNFGAYADTVGGSRYNNAISFTFGPDPEAAYFAST